MAIAASGSAHRQPSHAFSPMPASAITDKYAHSDVCAASAIIARLPSSIATRLLSRASSGITTTDRQRRISPVKIVHVLDAFVRTALRSDPPLLANWNRVKRVQKTAVRAPVETQ